MKSIRNSVGNQVSTVGFESIYVDVVAIAAPRIDDHAEGINYFTHSMFRPQKS